VRHALYSPCFGTFGDTGLLVDLAAAAEDAGWADIRPAVARGPLRHLARFTC
jgi:hypothetical protein